jgi:signal transduction histidine kinase
VADDESGSLFRENERLRREVRAQLEEQEALRRVAVMVAGHPAADEVFQLVTVEVSRPLDADAAMTTRFTGHGEATVLADWAAPGLPPFPVGEPFELGEGTALARVQTTQAPARVDSYATLESAHAERLRDLDMHAAVAAPILVDGRLWGAVAAGSAHGPFPTDAEARLGAFAELVGQAIANVDARLKLRESRARVVEEADAARRRIERDLHDGAQQRLVGLALQLRILSKSVDGETAPALDSCIDELLAALKELRELARGIHPAVLTDHGLGAALEALAARSTLPVHFSASLPERLPPALEVALYFVVSEALANVAKYAKATSVRLDARVADGRAEVTVSDDGVGGALGRTGGGLRGLLDRVDALDGHITVDSPPGHGTTVHAWVPVPPDERGIRVATAASVPHGPRRPSRSPSDSVPLER